MQTHTCSLRPGSQSTLIHSVEALWGREPASHGTSPQPNLSLTSADPEQISSPSGERGAGTHLAAEALHLVRVRVRGRVRVRVGVRVRLRPHSVLRLCEAAGKYVSKSVRLVRESVSE